MIPYGRQHITESDIEAVVTALKSDFLTQGPTIEEFEKDFSAYVDSKYAVAVSNGTAALHLSALALGIKKGQKVICSPITFSASSNAVLYAGGEVAFVDIDRDTYLLDFNQVESLLKRSKPGEYAGVIPVDFTGLPVNTEELKKLADKYGIWILEDACHAPGGFYQSRSGEQIKCGNGHYSDLTIFSFHPVKHIACGEGGMITTNSESLYHELKKLRTHGITKDSKLLEENHGGWYYEMQSLGYNYRLTDIQAALGISQLKRADSGLKRRNEIARLYSDKFESLGLRKQKNPEYFENAYHLYIIESDYRKELFDFLKTNKVGVQVHYIPVHLMPFYRKMGYSRGQFPKAEDYYSKCISLPMFPTLTLNDQEYVIQLITEFYKNKI